MWQRVAGMLLALGVLTGSVVAQTTTAKAAAPAAEAEPMVESSWMNMSWPKFEMPKVNWKGPFAGGEDQPAAEGEGFLTAPFRKVTGATQNGIAKTRAKWNSTVDKFRIGGGGEAAAAGSTTPAEEKPSFFAKMFGGGEPETKVPLTTSEFLAQERPGMDTK
jgi:hypothetical protein